MEVSKPTIYRITDGSHPHDNIQGFKLTKEMPDNPVAALISWHPLHGMAQNTARQACIDHKAPALVIDIDDKEIYANEALQQLRAKVMPQVSEHTINLLKKQARLLAVIVELHEAGGFEVTAEIAKHVTDVCRPNTELRRLVAEQVEGKI